MIKIDFEFVSTHRNRSVWPNPCLFEVPWSGTGQSVGLNAGDPVSNQVPELVWTGQNIFINVVVVSQNNNSVIVTASTNSFSRIPNYYQGAIFNAPPSFRIDGYKFIGQSGGLDYVKLDVKNYTSQVGTATIQVANIPNTVYIPAGSNLVNSYVGKYLYNETLGQSTVITDYDPEFHKVIAAIPSNWSTTDKYDIRNQLPAIGNFAIIGTGNTTNTIDLTGIGTVITPGDFIRIVSNEHIVMITNYDTTTNLATISPSLSTALVSGAIIELLVQTSDNYKTLSYAGTNIGQNEQVSYDVSLVSATLPNVPIKNGVGGYGVDYPFLYIEFYDTHHPSQNNLCSNNHSNKSYFKITTPIGQVNERNEKFTKFTGDLSVKTIRFRPTSNFRIVWRLPSGEEIKFDEQDTQSPHAPNPKLQTSVKFNLKRS